MNIEHKLKVWVKEYAFSFYEIDYPDIQCQEPVRQIWTCPQYRDKGVELLELSIQYHTCHCWGRKLSEKHQAWKWKVGHFCLALCRKRPWVSLGGLAPLCHWQLLLFVPLSHSFCGFMLKVSKGEPEMPLWEKEKRE